MFGSKWITFSDKFSFTQRSNFLFTHLRLSTLKNLFFYFIKEVMFVWLFTKFPLGLGINIEKLPVQTLLPLPTYEKPPKLWDACQFICLTHFCNCNAIPRLVTNDLQFFLKKIVEKVYVMLEKPNDVWVQIWLTNINLLHKLTWQTIISYLNMVNHVQYSILLKIRACTFVSYRRIYQNDGKFWSLFDVWRCSMIGKRDWLL